MKRQRVTMMTELLTAETEAEAAEMGSQFFLVTDLRFEGGGVSLFTERIKAIPGLPAIMAHERRAKAWAAKAYPRKRVTSFEVRG